MVHIHYVSLMMKNDIIKSPARIGNPARAGGMVHTGATLDKLTI